MRNTKSIGIALAVALLVVLTAAALEAGGWRCKQCKRQLPANFYCHYCAKQYAYQPPQPKRLSESLESIARKQLEYGAMLEGLSALGFVQSNSYTQRGAQQYYSEQQIIGGTGMYAANPYAYRSSFSSVDASTLYDSADRHVSQAQRLAHDAQQQFLQLADAHGSASIEASKIAAFGQATAQMLAAQRQGTTRYEFRVEPRGEPIRQSMQLQQEESSEAGGGMEADPPPAPPQPPRLSQDAPDPGLTILRAKCTRCHGGAEPAAGLDMLGEISEDQWRSIGRVLVTGKGHNDGMQSALDGLTQEDKLTIMGLQ